MKILIKGLNRRTWVVDWWSIKQARDQTMLCLHDTNISPLVGRLWLLISLDYFFCLAYQIPRQEQIDQASIMESMIDLGLC